MGIDGAMKVLMVEIGPDYLVGSGRRMKKLRLARNWCHSTLNSEKGFCVTVSHSTEFN